MPRWGCIADDYTGATDLATNFVSQGFRTVVVFGPPDDARHDSLRDEIGDADVVVVALKSRTAPVSDAVAESLAALDFLRELGSSRYYVKYCSTFDSTPTGNIGPVIDAVLERLGESRTIVVPSFPRAGRTVDGGTLFVNGQPLSESPMRHHPLTPMLDSSVPRLLEPQTHNGVELIGLDLVRAGVGPLREEICESGETARRSLVVIDAVTEDDLRAIAEASDGLTVVTGGSGLALGYVPGAGAAADHDPRSIPISTGRRAVLCGSASQMTRAQVAHGTAELPSWKIDTRAFRDGFDAEAARAVAWATALWRHDEGAIPLFYSVATLDDVDPSDPEASDVVERALAAIARGLVVAGARQLIVAGGETSGAVVAALDIATVAIGPEIAAGVAWSSATTGDGMAVNLALKSGNFGSENMFTSAWERLA
jgi:uncharacterized protein YgbK (DUF1537 family)